MNKKGLLVVSIFTVILFCGYTIFSNSQFNKVIYIPKEYNHTHAELPDAIINVTTTTKTVALGTIPNVEEAHRICANNERISYIGEQCEKTSVKNVEDYSQLYYVKPNSQFLAVPKHNVIYCQVSKDACSTWKAVIISSLEGDHIKKISAARSHRRSYLESLGIVFLTKWLPEHNNYTKFMVTRHPLDRLLSGYSNMIEKPPRAVGPSYSYNKWINEQLYGQSLKEKDDIASFEDFLQLVSSKNRKIRQSVFYNDRHWLPMSQVCQPCSVEYDYIVRLETADVDAKPVLKLLNLQDEHLPNKNSIRKTEQLKNINIGQSFVQEYADIPSYIMKNIFDRYHLDFTLYGYKYNDLTQELSCNIRPQNRSHCC